MYELEIKNPATTGLSEKYPLNLVHEADGIPVILDCYLYVAICKISGFCADAGKKCPLGSLKLTIDRLRVLR